MLLNSIQTKQNLHFHIFRFKNYDIGLKMSVVIGILIKSTEWYNRVKQRRSRLVLGCVIVSVCQFLMIVLQMRL